MTWGGGWEVHEGGDICIHIADSLCCAAETSITCKATITQTKKNSGHNAHNPTYPREYMYWDWDDVLRTCVSWPEGLVWSFMGLFIVRICIVFNNMTLSINLFLQSSLLWFLNFIYFLAVLCLHCCAWASSSCGVRASHHTGFSCYRARALGRVGFSGCGPGALLPSSIWNSSGPGVKPMFPALASRLSSTVPPGKSSSYDF